MGNDWKNIISRASGRDGTFAKTLRCDASRQSAQQWNHNDLNVEPLLLRIKRSPVLWIVRAIRMSQQRLAKHVQLVAPTEKRPRGRPKTSWSDYTSDLAGSRISVEPAELFEIAVDREQVRVLGLLPRKPAQFKRGYENKWIDVGHAVIEPMTLKSLRLHNKCFCIA